jgi:hypothetical protein
MVAGQTGAPEWIEPCVFAIRRVDEQYVSSVAEFMKVSTRCQVNFQMGGVF